MPGPVGKRDAERHGHHTPALGAKATKVDIASLFDDQEPDEAEVIDMQPSRYDSAPWDGDPEDDGRDVLDHRRAPRIPLQFEPPPPNPTWEPAAKEWYLSLHESGQAIFYEPSDWATAWIMAESISRDLAPQFVAIAEATGEVIRERVPLKGASLGAYLKGFTQLMATEGERRRLRIELERHKIGDATKQENTNVVSIREGLV